MRSVQRSGGDIWTGCKDAINIILKMINNFSIAGCRILQHIPKNSGNGSNYMRDVSKTPAKANLI